jgi:hypothetical protein
MRREPQIADLILNTQARLTFVRDQLLVAEAEFQETRADYQKSWHEGYDSDIAAALACLSVASRELRMAKTAVRSASLCNP